MKRIIALLSFVMLFATLSLAASVSVMAAGVENFKITGGISLDKPSEITFDSTRVISGTAEKGAKITITLYEPYTTADGTTAYNIIRTYSVTVGNTGIFSQSVSLREGKNYIVVAAYKDGRYSEAKTTVNRKNKVLQAVLSQSIAVPGGGF